MTVEPPPERDPLLSHDGPHGTPALPAIASPISGIEPSVTSRLARCGVEHVGWQAAPFPDRLTRKSDSVAKLVQQVLLGLAAVVAVVGSGRGRARVDAVACRAPFSAYAMDTLVAHNGLRWYAASGASALEMAKRPTAVCVVQLVGTGRLLDDGRRRRVGRGHRTFASGAGHRSPGLAGLGHPVSYAPLPNSRGKHAPPIGVRLILSEDAPTLPAR